MFGIYKITNKLNNKCYIGKASHIESRWDYHRTRYNDASEWNKHLYKAIRQDGLDNFSFEVLEEMDEEYYNKFANNREEYWIIYYNSLIDGYNETPGGDGGYNPKALEKTRKLTIDEVKHIRDLYNSCEVCMSDAYELYQDKISKRGFSAVWLGQNYKSIKPEVFTLENKRKHALIEGQRNGRIRREKHGK